VYVDVNGKDKVKQQRSKEEAAGKVAGWIKLRYLLATWLS